MKQSKQILAILLTCIAAICLIAAVVLLFKYAKEDMQSEAVLEEFRPIAGEILEPVITPAAVQAIPITPEPTIEPSPIPAATDAPTPSPTVVPTPEPIPNPYAESYLANADMAGWLVIPNTKIDYPVMWTPEDENYYLRRGFDKKKNSAGCLILDTDSSLEPLTTNLIIHGHNMKAGTMFGTLSKYEDEDFYKEHKQIILHTRECRRNYEVIAVFRSQVYKKTDTVFKFYKFFRANTHEEFDDFYTNIKNMSLYDTGVTAELGDRFITLSTCSYHVDNGRFVVVAKEVEPGPYYLPIE